MTGAEICLASARLADETGKRQDETPGACWRRGEPCGSPQCHAWNMTRDRSPAYKFRAKDVRALTPAQRRWFAEWDARMAASNARCARRVESIADLNPEIAARNARLHAWANGWRKSQVAAEPVPLVNVKRQGTVRVVEGVAADGTRIVENPLAPSRGRKPTWYVRRGDALVRVA